MSKPADSLASAFAAWQPDPAPSPGRAARRGTKPAAGTPMDAALRELSEHLPQQLQAFDQPANPLLEREQKHWSASQLLLFQGCPEQYRRRYILGQKERPGAALIQGRADHKAAEHNLRQKIQSHEDLPIGDVTDAFADEWAKAISDAGGESEVQWGDTKPADLKTQAAKLVRVFHQEAAPAIQPVAVEEEFLLTLPGVNLPIKGFVDVRTSIILERKTASKRQTLASKPDWRFQAWIYGTQYRLPVAFVQSVKTKVPAVYTDGVSIDAPSDTQVSLLAKMVARLEQTMQFYLATIGPDEPWPGAITHPWRCSYCGWRPSCTWWTA